MTYTIRIVPPINTLKGDFESDVLTKNHLNTDLEEIKKMMDSVMINMDRATHIINCFK